MNYATYKTTLAEMAVMDSENNTEFVAILPRAIEYAENRIYRELDLLGTVVRQNGTLPGNTRDFTLPTTSGRFVTVTGVNKLASGARTPLVLTSREVIDTLWPAANSSTSSGPQFYAMITDQTIIVGPTLASNLTLEVVGTIRPTALSSDNSTTFLSNYLSDLFLAASMVFITGWQKNWGSQADDPKMAQSWENQYQLLKASANVEELKKKFGSMPRG